MRTLPHLALAALLVGGCSEPRHATPAETGATTPTEPSPEVSTMDEPAADDATSNEPAPADGATTQEGLATFGAGCFWCIEAVLEQIDGVGDVVSGYMGGHVDDPTYKQICNGDTGHAEVVQIHFDPSVISYGELLEWFWRLHDPTTLNRQGNDVGTQYRSAIFYHSDAQRTAAEESKRAADASGHFDRPIVTEISAASTFYEAEGYHQDYYRGNRQQGYCRMVIAPKLDKLGLDK